MTWLYDLLEIPLDAKELHAILDMVMVRRFKSLGLWMVMDRMWQNVDFLIVHFMVNALFGWDVWDMLWVNFTFQLVCVERIRKVPLVVLCTPVDYARSDVLHQLPAKRRQRVVLEKLSNDQGAAWEGTSKQVFLWANSVVVFGVIKHGW